MKETFPTPDMTHLVSIEFSKVYEPAEDTFLLLDALEDNINEFRATRPSVICEVGSGSGCVITFLSLILKTIGPAVFSIATDINPHATRATQCTAVRNLVSVDSVMTSMCQGLRINGVVDVLVFNPPYVPSEDIVVPSRIASESIIDAAFAGGPDGRYWIDKFLPQVHGLLSPTGSFWLVVIENNRPTEIMALARDKWGLKSKVVKQRKAGFEMLYILKFWK